MRFRLGVWRYWDKTDDLTNTDGQVCSVSPDAVYCSQTGTPGGYHNHAPFERG